MFWQWTRKTKELCASLIVTDLFSTWPENIWKVQKIFEYRESWHLPPWKCCVSAACLWENMEHSQRGAPFFLVLPKIKTVNFAQKLRKFSWYSYSCKSLCNCKIMKTAIDDYWKIHFGVVINLEGDGVFFLIGRAAW